MWLLLLLVFITPNQFYTESVEMATEESILKEEKHSVHEFETANSSSKIERNNQLYSENRDLGVKTIDRQPEIVDVKNAIHPIIDGIWYKINVMKSMITAIDQQVKPLMKMHAQDLLIYLKEHKYSIKAPITKPFTTIQPIITEKPIIIEEPITTIKPTIKVEPTTNVQPITTVEPVASVDLVTIEEPAFSELITTEEPQNTLGKSITVTPKDYVSYAQEDVNNEFPESRYVTPPSYQIPLHQQNIYYPPPTYQFWPNNYFPQPNPQIDYQQNIQYVPYSVFTNSDTYSSGNLNFPGINYQNTEINYQPTISNSMNARPVQPGYTYDKPEPAYLLNPIYPYVSQMTRPQASSNLVFPKSRSTFSDTTMQPIFALDSSLLAIEHRVSPDDSPEELDLNQFERSTSALNNGETKMWPNHIPFEKPWAHGLPENVAMNQNLGETSGFGMKISPVFKSNKGILDSNVKI